MRRSDGTTGVNDVLLSHETACADVALHFLSAQSLGRDLPMTSRLGETCRILLPQITAKEFDDIPSVAQVACA